MGILDLGEGGGEGVELRYGALRDLYRCLELSLRVVENDLARVKVMGDGGWMMTDSMLVDESARHGEDICEYGIKLVEQKPLSVFWASSMTLLDCN